MPRRLTRRRFALLGSLALAGLAGCEDVGEGVEDEEGEDDDEGDDQEEGDDADGEAEEEAVENDGEDDEEERLEPPQNRKTAPQ